MKKAVVSSVRNTEGININETYAKESSPACYQDNTTQFTAGMFYCSQYDKKNNPKRQSNLPSETSYWRETLSM